MGLVLGFQERASARKMPHDLDLGMKAVAMWRGTWSTVRRVAVSLLMLATLLVYAVPGHASLMPRQHSSTPHEHGLAGTHGDGLAAVADHEHEQDPCKDPGRSDDGACCSVAQCATMHGGLPVGSVVMFVPAFCRTSHLPALATPDGIGTDPALRPPSLTI